MTQRQAEPEGFPSLTDPLTRESAPLFVENLLRGEKPREEWMCGVEFELFGYDRARGLRAFVARLSLRRRHGHRSGRRKHEPPDGRARRAGRVLGRAAQDSLR